MRRGLVSSAVAAILDFGPNDRNCPQAVRALRAAGIHQPLLVLAGSDGWQAKVENLDAGADDYLCKPVRSEEVAARLRALIRRTNGNSSSGMRVGDIELDIQARCAWRNGMCLELTKSEFRLLQLFILYPDKTMTQREIQEYLQPDIVGHSPNAVEVLIARLRRKVGKDRIRTYRGQGYRLIRGDEPQDPPAPRGACKAGTDVLSADAVHAEIGRALAVQPSMGRTSAAQQ